MKGASLILCFCVTLGSAATPAAIAGALDRLDVLPTPKDMRLKPKGVMLSQGGKPQAAIVLPDRPDATEKAAAEVINDAVKRLGGAKLPVVTAAEATPQRVAGKNLIVLGRPKVNSVARSYWVHGGRRLVAMLPEDEQGYIIETRLYRARGGGSIIFIASRGSIGDYYGAATLAQLLLKKGDMVLAAHATVRDWPDCRKRWTWGRNVRNNTDVDFYARFKLNGHNGGFHPGRLIDPKDPRRYLKTPLKAVAAASRYGLDRGFTRSGLISADIASPRDCFLVSKKPFAQVDKEWDCCKTHGNHLYCFTRLKLYRAKMKRIAEAARATGIQGLKIHFADTDPQNYWPRRCPRCKAEFKDTLEDWARANARLARIFLEEMRKVSKELRLVFIFIPYSPRGLDEVDYRWKDVIRIYREQVPFDENCYILVREDCPGRMALWRKRWGGMKMFYYLNMFDPSPSPLVATRLRYLDSFLAGGPDDIIWPMNYRRYPDPMNALLAAERLWNRRSCGPGFWPKARDWPDVLDARPKSPGEAELIGRICRKLYGYEAGAYLAEMYLHGLNPGVAAAPVAVGLRTNTSPSRVDALLRANLEPARKACAAVTAVIGKKIPVAPDGRRFFPIQYRLAVVTLALTEARVALLDARAFIAKGKDADARALVKRALARLKERERTLDRSNAVFRSWPPAYSMKDDGHRTWRELHLSDGSPGLSPGHAGGIVEDVARALQGLAKSPEEVRAALAARTAAEALKAKPLPTVVARFTKAPPIIDGKPDDAVWRQAKWVNEFVRMDARRMARFPTRAAVAWDDGHLYFFFEGETPPDARPALGKPDAKAWSPLNEYFEAMVSPDTAKGFYQFFLRSDGKLGDVFFAMPRRKGNLYRAQSAGEAAAIGEEVARARPQANSGWRSKTRAKARVGKGRWTAEVALPIAPMKQGPFKQLRLKRGDTWRVNLCRSVPKTPLFPPDFSSLTRSGYAAYWLFPKMELR